MRKLALLAAVTILTALGSTIAIKSAVPPAANASTPENTMISVEEIQRLLDVGSLPVLEVKEPF